MSQQVVLNKGILPKSNYIPQQGLSEQWVELPYVPSIAAIWSYDLDQSMESSATTIMGEGFRTYAKVKRRIILSKCCTMILCTCMPGSLWRHDKRAFTAHHSWANYILIFLVLDFMLAYLLMIPEACRIMLATYVEIFKRDYALCFCPLCLHNHKI